MKSITDWLVCDRIRCNSEVTSKKRALELLSELLATGQAGLSPRPIFDSLFGRERLGSTALDHGVALPHGRFGQSVSAIGAFITVAGGGVDFDARDGQAVHLIFGLLVPEHYTDEHLNILSHLAEMFSDAALRTDLRACTQQTEVFEVLSSFQPTSTLPI